MLTLFSALTVITAVIYIVANRRELAMYKSIANQERQTDLSCTDNATHGDICKHSDRRDERNTLPSAWVKIEINRCHSRGLTSAALCCLFFAATMSGHFMVGAVAQAVVASLALIASTTYAYFLNEKKVEALCVIESREQSIRRNTKAV